MAEVASAFEADPADGVIQEPRWQSISSASPQPRQPFSRYMPIAGAPELSVGRMPDMPVGMMPGSLVDDNPGPPFIDEVD